MKPGRRVLLVVFTLFATLGITSQAFAQRTESQFITFDAPGAGIGSGQGTVPRSINPTREITGEYYDSSSATHGFVRSAEGISHGFLRDRDGTVTKFDVVPSLGTFPQSINPDGEITGLYMDTRGTHGFLRARDGDITTFDVPGATMGTIAISINPRGEITGNYFDASSVARGLVRAKDGDITTFAVPGAGGPFFGDGTIPQSINPSGEITGLYTDAIGAYHGFLREPDDNARSED